MDVQPDIQLQDEVRAVQTQILEERRNSIRRKINIIYGAYRYATGSVKDCELKLAKAQAALKKEQEKLAKLDAGDWSIIPMDEKEKGQKENENIQGASD